MGLRKPFQEVSDEPRDPPRASKGLPRRSQKIYRRPRETRERRKERRKTERTREREDSKNRGTKVARARRITRSD